MHVLALENGQQKIEWARRKRASVRSPFTRHVHMRDRGNSAQVFFFGLGMGSSDGDGSATPELHLRACSSPCTIPVRMVRSVSLDPKTKKSGMHAHVPVRRPGLAFEDGYPLRRCDL